MAISGGAHSGVFGKRRHRRNPVMSEINVTPMVDVMLVLLIIFMVSAPLLTVGVPIDLPQTQASSLDQADKEPLAVSVNTEGKVFLQNTEIPLEELVPKLKAIAQARGGNDERIYVRGDKTVDYGTVMKVMGRLSAAGFRRVALVTEVEQGSVKLPEMKTGLTISALVSRSPAAVGADLVCREAARGQAERRAAGRHHLGQAVLRDHQGREERAKDKPPAPLAEKIGDAEAGRGIRRAKVTDKKEINAAKAEAAAAAAEQPPAPKPRAKPEKKEPPKIDPIAETLKKEEAKKKAEDKAKAKAAQQAQPSRSRSSIRPRSRRCSTSASRRGRPRPAKQLSPAPSLGKSDGNAAQLSQSEIDALRKRLGECWNPPAGAADGGQLKVVLRVLFKPDATVATPPQLVAAHGLAVRAGDGGKRQARDPDLPAVHHAAARALPAMERHRDHLRPPRNVRRLTRAIQDTA